jgi:hypothetical protein
MAIGEKEVYEVLGQLLAEGRDFREIRTDDLQMALKNSKHKSSGNRNKVNGWFNAWCVENGIERKKSGKSSIHIDSKAPSPANIKKQKRSVAECNDSIINRLPESLRNHVVMLITAICSLIGIVRSQERDAATMLIEHAKQEQQEELAKANQRIAELEDANKKLLDENATLKSELLAKQQTVTAEQLLSGMAKLLKNNTLESIINTNQPKAPAAEKTKEPVKAKSKTKVAAKSTCKTTPAAGVKKNTKKTGGKKAA